MYLCLELYLFELFWFNIFCNWPWKVCLKIIKGIEKARGQELKEFNTIERQDGLKKYDMTKMKLEQNPSF